jgi:hypothetical protein
MAAEFVAPIQIVKDTKMKNFPQAIKIYYF